MTPVLWWIIQELVSILVLVVLVSVACLALRNRPAWRHALWLVVLIKFIIPPVVSWPWSLSDVVDRVMPASNAEVASSLPVRTLPISSGGGTELPVDEKPPLVDGGAIVSGVDEEQASVFDDELIDRSADAASVMDSSTDSPSLVFDEAAMALTQWVLIGMWSVGCVFALAVQFRRLRRQGNIVCRGSPAPQPLVTEIERASREMNVRSVPATVVSETASPFLWCLGRLRLIWPETLAGKDALIRSRGMIAHELAHVRRRDHWVAWLELAVGVIWWWNPLFWFVRRKLRESAETACDAIALSVYEDRREYAEMFLEMSSTSGPLAPAQVLGVDTDTRACFERRIAMILSDRGSGTVSAWGVLLAFCVAAVFLPAWSLAQNSSASKNGASVGPTTIVNEAPRDASPDARGDAAKNNVESSPSTVIPEDTPVYGARDWAGWFANHARHRKQEDGTFPPVAFKYLRKHVIEDLAAEPNASGAAEARAWLEVTGADKNWVEDDFKSTVERIGKWKLSVIQRAMGNEEFASRCSPKKGRPATPDELRGISFGPAAENGLRIAWVFDPAKEQYAVGTTLKCRVIVHNSGSQPVQFLGTLDHLDGDWSIRNAAGKPIQIQHIPYSTVWLKPRLLPYQRYRLEPGHLVELVGQGIGIGKGDHSPSRTQIAIWRIIDARPGDTVRISVETDLVSGESDLSAMHRGMFCSRDEFPEEQARDWSGSLRSGEVKFNVVAADEPAEPAAELSERARVLGGKIPDGPLGMLMRWQPVDSSKEWDTDKSLWLRRIVLDMKAIKPGATRADLSKRLLSDGPTRTCKAHRYQHPKCPFVKIDVFFDVEDVLSVEDHLSKGKPNDKAIRIEGPFLDLTSNFQRW